MVDISPFRAVRYDLGPNPDLSLVLAPPYDVISDARREELYAKSPHNVVRVDYGRPAKGDGPNSVYERAAQFLAEWRAEGVLRDDEVPAFYVLAQTFVGPDDKTRTRTGFFSRARLTRFGEGPIMPHERTLKGPKEDRLRLYRATRMNLSSIFGAFQDPDGTVRAGLERARSEAPIATGTLDGVKNELFRITDPARLGELEQAFRAKKLYIADGHHRYETGLAYRDERRKAAGTIDPNAPYEHILMFAAAVEDPGMVIFPTHRLVHGIAGLDLAALAEKLSRDFELRPLGDDPAAAFAALDEAGRTGNAFVMVSREARHLLVRRKDADPAAGADLPAHPALRDLDVSVLHGLVLERGLGIDQAAQAAQSNLRYSKAWNDAFAAPREIAEVQLAFLMNPTKMDEVIHVAESGEVMPQKSTYFVPKLPSGLLMSPLG